MRVKSQRSFCFELESFVPNFSHSFLVRGVEVVCLLFLLVCLVLNVSKGELDGDGYVFDAGNVEIPSFEQCFCYKLGHLPLTED